VFTTIIAEEDTSQDPLRSILPDSWRASEQFALPAVELAATKNGYEVAVHKDEVGKQSPSIGVICEPKRIFLDPLKEIKPDGRIIKVKGSGSKPTKANPTNRRRYQFTDVGEALPLTVSFDFEQFLKDLGDSRHEQRALALPNGWFQWWINQRRSYWQQTAPTVTATTIG
jgi:hypothetical protein